jgi:hypothetical protein
MQRGGVARAPRPRLAFPAASCSLFVMSDATPDRRRRLKAHPRAVPPAREDEPDLITPEPAVIKRTASQARSELRDESKRGSHTKHATPSTSLEEWLMLPEDVVVSSMQAASTSGQMGPVLIVEQDSEADLGIDKQPTSSPGLIEAEANTPSFCFSCKQHGHLARACPQVCCRLNPG